MKNCILFSPGLWAVVGLSSLDFLETPRRLISSGGFFMPSNLKLVESLTRACKLLGSPLKLTKIRYQPFDHFSEVATL
jgi:hypothetical protein